ncbi:hypothetical protein ANCCEY_15118, partial [Ancylostoma ceylanicum]
MDCMDRRALCTTSTCSPPVMLESESHRFKLREGPDWSKEPNFPKRYITSHFSNIIRAAFLKNVLSLEVGACGTVLLSNEDGTAGESMDVVQDHTAISKADCTAICDEKMDITQLSNEVIETVPCNDDFNRTALMCDTLRTLAEQIEDEEIGPNQHNATENCSILSALNESNIARRDISLLVMYANPADDQPEGNLVREQIVEELTKKLVETRQRSECDFEALFPKLQARDAAKALAVKNMNPRALSIDEADLLQSARLRAEIEWANIRAEVATQAISGIEQCLAEDAPLLKQLCEDAQLCERLDELEKEVKDLENSIGGAPSPQEVAEILDSYERAVREEEDLDSRILDKEIEELRLELQLHKLRNEELRKQNDQLSHIANTLEKNEARVRDGLPIGANEFRTAHSIFMMTVLIFRDN